MRRIGTFLGLVILLVTVPGVAGAKGGASGLRVQASGVFVEAFAVPYFEEGNTRVQLVAHSDAGGANPRGHFTATQSRNGNRLEAEISCISVAGDLARVGLVVTESNVALTPGSFFYYVLRDKPGGGSRPLSIDATGPSTGSPAVCPAPFNPGFSFDGPIHVS